MKLRLRIGRQQAQTLSTVPPARTPPPITPRHRVVRAGSFCPASDIGQAAVTRTGRAVLAIRAGRCGRWVYTR